MTNAVAMREFMTALVNQMKGTMPCVVLNNSTDILRKPMVCLTPERLEPLGIGVPAWTLSLMVEAVVQLDSAHWDEADLLDQAVRLIESYAEDPPFSDFVMSQVWEGETDLTISQEFITLGSRLEFEVSYTG